MSTIVPESGESLLDLGKHCNAVYVCPKLGDVRKGDLVAYAGKDGKGRNLVGDIYFNFAKIEPHPFVVQAFARAVHHKLQREDLLHTFDTICGIPHGGRTFGQELARVVDARFVYADKKPKPTEPGKKQEYTWDLSRFEFEKGERVAIAEDVYNNFQNTDNTLAEIAASGANVVLLVGALNRSPIYDTNYKGLPVVASIRQAYPEYEQDDPAVAADVAAGRVEFEVKKNWPRLCALMEAYRL
ncbi:MAG: phosphoribosyltransferase [Patescibacteria group bacterium]